MKRASVLLAVVILTCGPDLVAQGCRPGSLGGAFAFDTTYRGKNYDSCVDLETIAETPSWSETDDFPPLSPREAIRSAKGELSALVTDPQYWTLREIKLMPGGSQDKWIYVVSFEGPATSPYRGVSDEFHMMVLMDGKAAKPRVYSLPVSAPAAP